MNANKANLWRITGAAVTGQGHIIHQQPCQDAWHAHADGDWLIAAVADGAGSASMGREGAAHIVHALGSFLRKCLATATDNSGYDNEEFADYWAAQIKAAIAVARNQLNDGRLHKELRTGTVKNANIHDFHSTIVGAVCNAKHGLIFHLGDGFAAADNGNWSPANTVSKPENGEYANETFFYTQTDWLDHLRFTELTERPESLWLMTDGAASFAADGHNTGLDEKFAEPVHRYLSDHPDPVLRTRALEQTLSADATNHITHDDKTLLWCSPCGK